MKTLNSKRGRTGLLSALLFSLMACTFTACDDELDVQQSFPFTIETMPVPSRLVMGETVEIRCELKREGRFADTRYTIRYFQPDGNGSLLLDNGMKLLPNDRYPLDREVFRLYYTSECDDRQSIDIYFEDNSEPVRLFQLTFDFNNDRTDDTEDNAEGAGRNSGIPQIGGELVNNPLTNIKTVTVCE